MPQLEDLPPESFWLSKDSEYDWFDRKESTNGQYSNSSTKLNPQIINQNSNSKSHQFFSVIKSRASILGLPKTQKITVFDSRRTCKPGNVRLFPKRTEPVGKSAVSTAEPGSPKVSCMGRVRSKRGRRGTEKTGVGKQKTGFYSAVMSMFRSGRCCRKSIRSGSGKVVEEPAEEVFVPQRKSVGVNGRKILESVEVAAEPPGLGGMKRFSSGRQSGSWTAEDFNQAVSASLESDRIVGPVGGS